MQTLSLMPEPDSDGNMICWNLTFINFVYVKLAKILGQNEWNTGPKTLPKCIKTNIQASINKTFLGWDPRNSPDQMGKSPSLSPSPRSCCAFGTRCEPPPDHFPLSGDGPGSNFTEPWYKSRSIQDHYLYKLCSASVPVLHIKFYDNQHSVLKKTNFWGFHHVWACRPFWSSDMNREQNLVLQPR